MVRLALTSMLVLYSLATAQSAGDRLVEKRLRTEVATLGVKYLDGAKSLEEWKKKLPRLRRKCLDMLGLWPLPERTPLRATTTGTLVRDSITVEKLHFQSKPGLYVTANLYRPSKINSPLPAILYVCGHSGRGRDGNKTAFQNHGFWFARNGYVCLIVDTLQLGEIPGIHHGTYRFNRWWWQSLAYTPAGVECWNGIRAIDYLVSRKDVDAERIGVTGISGGGATTIWIAATDERVKVAVPVSGMSDLESYVNNKVINGHCDCMFLVNLYRWNWSTIAALIAPRPLLFANSDADPIFPMDGNRRIMSNLREIYKLWGKSELVEEYVSRGGHDYRPDLRLAIFRFLNKHLKGTVSEIKDVQDPPLPGKDLRVFPEKKDLPRDAINARIDESFLATKRPSLPVAGKYVAWQRETLNSLREVPFSSLKLKPSLLGKLTPTPGMSLHGDAVLFVEDEELTLDTSAFKHDAIAKFHLQPSGLGETKWTKRNPPNYVERSFALVGRTVDIEKVEDVIAAVQKIKVTGSIKVVGRGKAGILAAYAALFEPRIAEVILIDPPATHRHGPHFLGILRRLDVPDALGLLAPRKLTLIGALHPDFDRTQQIYNLAGSIDRLNRVMPSRIDPRGLEEPLIFSQEEDDVSKLPDAIISFGKDLRGKKPTSGTIGFHVEPGTSLLVTGRRIGVSGSGKVTISLAASSHRPARAIELSGKKVEDLTALRRAARDRLEGFPPKKVGNPVVDNGTLVIVGGGGMPSGLVKRFVELAGGEKAKIVVLPTAVPKPTARDGFANSLRRAGAGKVTVLPGITLEVVQSKEYLDVLREATGIWFGGGRQWHFVDAYEGTKLLPLMHDVLKRGGVIGGSSAGATIQGEYLARGGVFNNFDIAYEGYERGFSFLPGVAIDQHFSQRKRFKDMEKLMTLFPQYLGIGIDEATAIIVQKSRADVVGRGKAFFYDAKTKEPVALSDGGSYDLATRKVIHESPPKN